MQNEQSKEEQKLDARSQEVLDEILKIDADQLLPHQISFLRARSSYLTGKEKNQYKSILKASRSKDQKDAEKLEAKKKKDAKIAEKVEVEKENIEKQKYEKLLADAKDFGIKTEGMTQEEIEKAIDAKLAKE